MVIAPFRNRPKVADQQGRVLPGHVCGKATWLDDRRRDSGSCQKSLGVEFPMENGSPPLGWWALFGPHGAAKDNSEITVVAVTVASLCR